MSLSQTEISRLLHETERRQEMVEAIASSLPFSPPTIRGLQRKVYHLTKLAQEERGWWNPRDLMEAQHLARAVVCLNRSSLACQRDALRNAP